MFATYRGPHELRSASLCAAAVFAASTFIGTAPAAAEPIEVSGSTLACVGLDCATFGTPVVADSYGLTITGTAFDELTDAAGAATVLLGTLSRGNVNVSDSTTALLFTLELIFGLPSAIEGGQALQMDATVTGSTPGGGGPLDVDFDNNWQSIIFPGGSFELAILTDPIVNKNGVTEIYGTIRSAVSSEQEDTPTDGPTDESVAVSEPMSLALVGSGMLIALARLRRRRR